MKTESCRTASVTASAATAASAANASRGPRISQRACAAKNVANRIARPAASSAFAVTAYRRAARSSQRTRSAEPAPIPIAIWTGSFNQPRSIE